MSDLTPETLAELRRRADAAFIAAASPAVVEGLLDRLAHMCEARDNARAEVERLTARLEDVEGALVELQPDPVLVEGSWIPFRDLATVCGNFMRSSAEHARAAKAAHVRVAELEAAVERVRAVALAQLTPFVEVADILRALDGEADQ